MKIIYNSAVLICKGIDMTTLQEMTKYLVTPVDTHCG